MRKGFMLSEVLITLGVIGVVAAITLPTFIKKYQQHVTINHLKKAYSELYQAVNMSVNDNDAVENWDFNLSAQEFCEKYLTPYIKNIKSEVKSTSTIVYTLSNGTTINCYMGKQVEDLIYGNMQIQIDINGDKGPNKNGRDRFYFYIFERQANRYNYGTGDTAINVPAGGLYYDGYGKSREQLKDNIWRGCNTSPNETGSNSPGGHCSGLIIYDGWKISDDYNW